MVKTIFSLAFLIFFTTACSNNTSKKFHGSDAFAEGFDYSGTYILGGVECYSSTTYQITDYAFFTSNISNMITIDGNTASEWFSDGTCSGETTGKYVFNSDNTLNTSEVTYKNVTGGSCTTVLSISNNPANHITPTNISNTVTSGQVISNKTVSYIRSDITGNLAILSTLSSQNPSDLCFLIYTRR